MDIQWLVANLGYVGLALGSALAATLLPFSSEALLTVAIASKLNVVTAVIAATIGNCLGITFNYFLGRIGHPLVHRYFAKDQIMRSEDQFRRYGTGALYFSWVPIMGDPITLGAGLLKIKFTTFAAISYSMRFLRYVMIALIATKFLS